MLNLFKSKRVYLDYAAATPVSKYVQEKINEVKGKFANPSGIYRSGVEIKNIIEKARKELLTYFRAEGMHLIFTSSATESINIALLGSLEKGDHFVTTKIEHPAVIECARFLQKEKGVEVTFIDVDEFGFVKKEDFKNSIKENTKLVSVMVVNNEIGTVQNMKEIGRVIDEYKRKNNSQFPKYHSDICQAINYFEVDMRATKLDMISFNSSKNYGGKGAGALIFKKDVQLKPIYFGGGQEMNLKSGTENLESIVALEASIYESKDLREKEFARLSEIQQYFFDEIKKEIPEVIICGPLNIFNNKKDNQIMRSPNNINIILPGMQSEEMILRLDYYGFEVSHKSACASMENEAGSYVLEAIRKTKKDSSENIRISMGRDTKKSDLENLLKEIKKIYSKFRV